MAVNGSQHEQCAKLTAYFGERQRTTAGEFVADAILDLFGTHDVATSVMLRGIAGFGPRHVLRSDGSLSLSEDPPVTIAAVDVEPKVLGLVDDVIAMTTRGLVSVERAQLLHPGDTVAGTYSRNTAKLTVYVGRQQQISGVGAHYAICERLYRHGFAGATVLLGVDGTAHGRRYRARFFSRNVDVPLMIIAIGTLAQASAAATELTATVPQALVTIERTQLCKRDGELFGRPQHPGPDEHEAARWQKLMVHTSEAARHDGLPIHRALVRRLLQSKSALGVTVLRGIWGFHGNHQPHGDRLFALTRRVPVTTIIVDTPQSIARSFDIVDELTGEHGLVTCEVVPAVATLPG